MRVYFTWSGVWLPRRWWALVAAAVVAALVVTAVPGVASVEDTPGAGAERPEGGTPKTLDSDGDGVPDRPDAVSAGSTARALGEPVEDLSRRTETSKTLVNPDGTSTLETSAGIQRIQGEDGTWQDIDLDLVKQADGSLAPRVAASDVVIGAGGSKLAATVNLDDDQVLSVTWPETLPEPTVEGGVATYKLSETSDLLVIATKTGVAAHVRLNERPAESDPALTMGLKTENLSLETTAKGELEVVDNDDTKVASTAPMKAWDAQVDDAGDPVNVVPVKPTLDEVSSNGEVARSELTLEPEAGFLEDPATEYPVIIDPDISAVSLVSDTMVRKGITNVHGTDPRLWVGRLAESASTEPWTSYIKWSNAQLAGRTILSATAKFYQYDAGNCSRQMNVHPLTSDLVAGTVYSNRPSFGTANWTSTTAGPCNSTDGWLSINVKSMVQAWANGTKNYGMRLAVPGDYATNYNYTRRFCSANENAANAPCNLATRNPVLSIKYNSPPPAPVTATVEAATSNGGTFHSSINKPKISAKMTDPEGTTVRSRIKVLQGSTVKQDVYSAYVASGGTATKELAALADGSYTVQVWANDSQFDSATYKTFPLVVDTVAPPTPTVTCTGGVASGQWYGTRPTDSTTCTVTSAGAKTITWNRNNKPQPALVPNASGVATTPSMGVANDGVLSMAFTATDIAGNRSTPPGKFGFGTGAGATITPVEGERTSSTTLVTAEGPGGANGAHIEYREPGDDARPWSTAVEVSGAAPTGSVSVTTGDFGTSLTPSMTWDMDAEAGIDAPAVRDMRVCFEFDGISKCTPSRQVTLVPSAFGSSFPTESFGPGTLALSTGEYSLDQTDVTVPGFGGDLTIGRSHRSFAGATSPAASVFGPGWVADLAGPDAGEASLEVVDHTAREAAITLVSPDGSSATYVHEDDEAAAQLPGYYLGDAETSTDNDVLELYSESGTKKLTLYQEDGTETTWKHLGSGNWVIEEVQEPFETGSTKYAHDSDGRVKAIYGAAPAGVSCNPSAQSAGCRALLLDYNTDNLLAKIDLRIWDPVPGTGGTPSNGAGMKTITVAEYTYANGRLATMSDPRVSSSMKTEYEYDTIGSRTKVTKITEPGLTPWRFTYATTGDNEGKLTTVKRAQTSGTGDAAWRVDYTTPLSGSGLPDLSTAAKVAAWGQTNPPVAAATVYGPDAPASPAPSDGTISYWDTEGRTTNTATYGAGDWQLDATTYDAKGNVVWALGEGNRHRALAASTEASESAEVANTLATITTYNADGTRVESTTGPTRMVVLKNGDQIAGRDYSETVYDDEAADENVPVSGRPTPEPDAPALNLPVEERSGVIDAEGGIFDIIRTRYRYDPIESGDGDGWVTGNATRTSTELGSEWSTTHTRYTTDGLLIASTTPEGVAASGTERRVRTTVTTYYTADNSASVEACRGKPQWVGLACQSGLAEQPTSGGPIPVEKTPGYDYLLNPTRVVESSGSMSRVDVTEYDTAGRKTSASTTVIGAPAGDKPVPATTHAYSPSTGLLTSVASDSQIESTTYDGWGRVISQIDGTGNEVVTTYDAADRVKTREDDKGTSTYTYDGTDANGKTEKRGLVTKLDVDFASGPDEITAAYDADGNTVKTVYPGGVTARRGYDPAGSETSLAWTDANDIDLAAFSQIVDVNGKVRGATSPSSSQTYGYDGRDRLTTVEDIRGEGCTTRQYTFSLDSNRTSLTRRGPTADGTCATIGGTTSAASFDQADRIIEPGYTYDALGRTRTVPATDTDAPDGSSLTATYHANDMVASLTQSAPDGVGGASVSTKVYRLDVSGRISEISAVETDAEVRRVTNHYDGSQEEDSPSWAKIETREDESAAWQESWIRYVAGVDGDLAIIAKEDGTAELQVSNLHDDVVATIDLANATSGLTSYSESDEYGVRSDRDPSSDTQYAWLGAKQRSSDAIGGLTLMGVRLYNPATGLFLTRDPVHRGNDNAYTYPSDPINMVDLDGRWAWVPVLICIRYCGKAYKAYRVYKTVCRQNSFDRDTPVLMADGRKKPIAQVELGELVLAAAPETDEAAPKRVTDLIRSFRSRTMVRVGLADGSAIDATDHHPFWVAGATETTSGKWVDAIDIRVGDSLLGADGQRRKVNDVKTSVARIWAFNLTVDGYHTYFAGDVPVLVHNAACPVHGHGKNKQSTGNKRQKHEKGNSRRQADQARSKNPNKNRKQCTCGRQTRN